jgi:hypothetical protein
MPSWFGMQKATDGLTQEQRELMRRAKWERRGKWGVYDRAAA